LFRAVANGRGAGAGRGAGVRARALAAELAPYDVGTATIRFSADKPLPARLVTKLVKARIAQNERRVMIG
jgi:uncharacterized protein YdhG (YjbR/CyaY superfamily)